MSRDAWIIPFDARFRRELVEMETFCHTGFEQVTAISVEILRLWQFENGSLRGPLKNMGIVPDSNSKHPWLRVDLPKSTHFDLRIKGRNGQYLDKNALTAKYFCYTKDKRHPLYDDDPDFWTRYGLQGRLNWPKPKKARSWFAATNVAVTTVCFIAMRELAIYMRRYRDPGQGQGNLNDINALRTHFDEITREIRSLNNTTQRVWTGIYQNATARARDYLADHQHGKLHWFDEEGLRPYGADTRVERSREEQITNTLQRDIQAGWDTHVKPYSIVMGSLGPKLMALVQTIERMKTPLRFLELSATVRPLRHASPSRPRARSSSR